MAWWDLVDNALQIQRDTFGEPCVVFFAAAPPEGAAVTGIFDDPAAHADLGLVRELSDQAPWVAFRIRDLPGLLAPRQGERVTVRGEPWEITDTAFDGSGHVKCRLFRLEAGATVAPLPALAGDLEPPAPSPAPYPVMR